MAKFGPSQNFLGIYTMIFSKKTTRLVSIPKIMKIYSGVGRYRLKILAKNFWPFWGSQKFFVVIEVVWRPNFMQKIRKKYEKVRL